VPHDIPNNGRGSIDRDHAQLAFTASRNLPRLSRLLICAVLLPAVVAAANQLMIATLPGEELRRWLYPAMAGSTALLSWCAGRYLYPAWLSWLVFAWSLTLLDLISIAVCVVGPIDDHFGYLMVTAQTCLVVLWAFLGTDKWQWRMTVVLIATPLIIAFTRVLNGSIYDRWGDPHWTILMLICTAVVALLCASLRMAGFSLRLPKETDAQSHEPDQLFQFSLRHMLVWSAALVPLLLVARGLDFLTFGRVNSQGVFPLILVAASLAIINLTAIWAVLGSGLWALRVAALFVIPAVFAYALHQLTVYLQSINQGWRPFTLLWVLYDVKDSWTSWLMMNSLLLAAILLFLRAKGYRLSRLAA
jgi:hypothetical protein